MTTVRSVQNWTRYTTAGDGSNWLSDGEPSVELGPGNVEGLGRKLLGDVTDQRVLDLGCGAGINAIALAHLGARVVAIDPYESQVAIARASSEAAEVHVEVHRNDVADLAFLHPESFDAVIAVHSLAAVPDLGRVFRQVHRLLKSERPLILTLPHPAALMADPEDNDKIVARYDETESLGDGHHLTHRHGVGHVFTQLARANYRIDTLLEPEGDGRFPASLVIRARKL